ncbi:hypothetical protein BHM03_00044412 [Ensete ventricosum]|nr:hypothetical protein BHM03_00044412 [Ensete ventricosum]
MCNHLLRLLDACSIFPSAFEEVQAMLVQGRAPELVVVLFVSVAGVNGRTPVAAHELLRGADHHAVAWAEEGRHRYPLPVGVDHRSMPHALNPSIA